MIELGLLRKAELRHAFFTREGGASQGLYASLNCGYGSGDAAGLVTENRRRAAAALGLEADRLVTVRQIHSPQVVVVGQPWPPGEAPEGDALVTAQPGIALAVLSADCVPVLFFDPATRVVGAAHAGWKGALGGVLEATLDAMAGLGAADATIRAAIGPAIQQASYEVGPEFRARFVAETAENERFFVPSPRPGRALFDLPRYVEHRLRRRGVTVERSPLDTCADAARFFSYRRATLRGEPVYGRGISAIALA